MYTTDYYSLDDLDLAPKSQALVTAGAGQAAQYAASFLPGGPVTGFVVGKAVGLTLGKVFSKSALTKYRRLKKKGTRQSAGGWGEKDCTQEQPYLTCKGATGNLREGCKLKGKPPNKEFEQAYRLAYQSCVNARADAREGSYKKRLWEGYPVEDPFVKRREKTYRATWEKRYDATYERVQQEAVETGGGAERGSRVNPWLLVGVAGLIILALREGAKK